MSMMSNVERIRLVGRSQLDSSQPLYVFQALRELYAQGSNALLNAVKWDLTQNLTRLSISDVGFGNRNGNISLADTDPNVLRFWESTKLNLEYLFLYRKVEITAGAAELVFAGLPNLKMLEYYALSGVMNHWPLNWGEVLPKSLTTISIRTFHTVYRLSGIYLTAEEPEVRDHLSSLLVLEGEQCAREIRLFCPAGVNTRSIERLVSEIATEDTAKKTSFPIVLLRYMQARRVSRPTHVRCRYPLF